MGSSRLADLKLSGVAKTLLMPVYALETWRTGVIATLTTSAALGLATVSTATATVALSLVPREDVSLLREAVAGIGRGVEREYAQCFPTA